MNTTTITPQELYEIRRSGKQVDLIDVRTPVEFREAHVEGARLVPLDGLDPPAVMTRRNGNAKEPLYVICRSGNRARQACERFVAAGFTDVVTVEGGAMAWEQAGLPLVRGKKAVSLERQVRIAAGSLVLLGAVLALAVHPWFVLLPAFVGSGLVFAGVTDACGMGLLLARMPWNQVKGQKGACCSR
ncbi:MAG TPA: sulfurtransferase [Planctomycetales bacterium]|jgi:rhodanese-related sulfurtransferase|nr:sulfurtransferase [Planctomycetales bacterium]